MLSNDTIFSHLERPLLAHADFMVTQLFVAEYLRNGTR